MKYKEIVSSEIPANSKLSYNSLDFLINRWIEENKGVVVHKIHYQLAGTSRVLRSSALIEYTLRLSNKNLGVVDNDQNTSI